MFISILLIILAIAIIFFHYIQGFFTSLFSAILALIAAGVAFAYYEPLTRMMKPTGFADYSPGLLLAVLFGVTYIVLRVIFDILIPGNVRLQFTVDKIGAVFFGAIAAICSVGIIAIAMQALPFGPSILGFSRYKLVDHREISISGVGDFEVDNVLENDKLDQDGRLSLAVPFDQMTLNLVGALSVGGLAGNQSLYAIHPDLLLEEYANNLGYQEGSRHAAWNYGDVPQVEVSPPQEVSLLRVVDDERPEVRKLVSRTVPKSPIKPDSSQILMLIPCTFTIDAVEADGGSVVRIATGSVRLVTHDQSSPSGFADHFPIGTVDLHDGILFADKPDDPIFVDVSGGGRGMAIFAFLLARDQVLQDSSAKIPQIAQGTFIEIKRLVEQDLSGQTVTPANVYSDKDASGVLHKTAILTAAGIAPSSNTIGGAAAPPASVEQPAAVNGPVTVKEASISDQLPGAVDAGNGKSRLDTNVAADLKNQKFDTLTVHVSEPVAHAAAHMVQTLFVPAGHKLLQVQATPKGQPWAWTDKFINFSVVAREGKKYQINGVWGHAKMPDGSVHFFAQYQADQPLTFNEGIDADRSAIPTELWLAFIVPDNAGISELDFNGQKYATLNLSK